MSKRADWELWIIRHSPARIDRFTCPVVMSAFARGALWELNVVVEVLGFADGFVLLAGLVVVEARPLLAEV